MNACLCVCGHLFMCYVCGKKIYRVFNTTDLLLEELGLSSESSQNKSANSVPAERGVRAKPKKKNQTKNKPQHTVTFQLLSISKPLH